MSLPKKGLLALNRLVCHATAKNHMTKPRIGDIDSLNDEHQIRQLALAYENYEKDERRREREAERARIRDEREETRLREPKHLRSRYGNVFYGDVGPSFRLEDLSADKVGQTVSFTARLHHVRHMSNRLVFLLLRQGLDTIQGVLRHSDDVVSDHFVQWAKHLNTESLVRVEGTVRAPPVPVESCTFADLEILVDAMHVLVSVDEPLAIDVFGVNRVEQDDTSEDPDSKTADQDTHEQSAPHLVASARVRENNRIVFLRTPAMQSVFRINAALCSLFRAHLETHSFLEIHTPKLQPAATESGADVFEVRYFGRRAFLAQSPQLAKQMCISADLGRVFEIGPVFRAEDSNTHRHLTEYTGLDLEMALERDYHEALDLVDGLLKAIFAGVYERCRREVDVVKTRFPHEDLVWLDETPRLTFKGGVALLNESGWTDEGGEPVPDDEDLSTRAEIRLGQLVREKYGTDYFILDKFPASARPFYTHLDPDNPAVTNSFDIFIRGQEIVTGGQRIHDARLLAERMADAGVDVDDMREYMQAFAAGAPPHAGCGIGLERLLFLLLDLGDIRNASLFPRDPKSLPERGDDKETRLPHPEADTIRYAMELRSAMNGYDDDEDDASEIDEKYHNDVDGNTENGVFAAAKRPELPTVENLISNYGDATNTSWLDDGYKVWRDDDTGAAIGYAAENGYALVMGDPLCDSRQYPVVIAAFLRHLRGEKDLRPLWLLVSREVRDILGTQLGWQTMSCVAEERVEVGRATRVAKKERQAENAGLVIHELPAGAPVPEDLRKRCDARIEDWKAGRKGRKQVHITEVRPWVDVTHRMFLWSEDREGQIAGLVVLHRLAPRHGYQVKFALDFPGSPSGAIEALISRALGSLASLGVREVTFGAGATPEMEVGAEVHRLRARVISRTYRHIAAQLKLVAKSEFRKKFGAEDEAVYICYPTMGLGVSGVRTLVKFFEDEM